MASTLYNPFRAPFPGHTCTLLGSSAITTDRATLVKRRNVFTHKSKATNVGYYHATCMACALKGIFQRFVLESNSAMHDFLIVSIFFWWISPVLHRSTKRRVWHKGFVWGILSVCPAIHACIYDRKERWLL